MGLITGLLTLPLAPVRGVALLDELQQHHAAREEAEAMAGKNGHVSAPQIVRRAIEQVAMSTGRQIEGVNGLEKGDDGWFVTLEVVQLRRVPDSTDVLGSYVVQVDERSEGIDWWENDPALSSSARKELETENRDLRERLERLETAIGTGGDGD